MKESRNSISNILTNMFETSVEIMPMQLQHAKIGMKVAGRTFHEVFSDSHQKYY